MSDLMREEFETAMAEMLTRDTADTVTALDLMNCRDGNEYKSHVLSSAWWAWQASRECLVIELPAWEEYSGTDEGAAQTILDCERSINAVGVKTK